VNEAHTIITELRDLAQRIDNFFVKSKPGPNTHTEAAILLKRAATVIEELLSEKDK
jgi:hypothetical protein